MVLMHTITDKRKRLAAERTQAVYDEMDRSLGRPLTTGEVEASYDDYTEGVAAGGLPEDTPTYIRRILTERKYAYDALSDLHLRLTDILRRLP